MLSRLTNFFNQQHLAILVQVGAVLTVLMKVLESTDSLNRFGRGRRARWLRQEIIALQEFQTKAPPQLCDVITNQLDDLYKQYVTVVTHQPRLPVYPTVPRWRQIFLLYLPARLTAVLPHLLFYLYIFAIVWTLPVWQIRKSDWALLFSIVFFFLTSIIWLHDWAVRAERKRCKREAMQTLFLSYRPPTAGAKYARMMFYYSVVAMTGFMGLQFKPNIQYESWMTWWTIGLLVALHDYARSFDVVPQESTAAPEQLIVFRRAGRKNLGSRTSCPW
jgi:hypothetical protein